MTTTKKFETAAEAIEAYGLAWKAEGREILTADGKTIPNYKALVRSDNGGILGVVGNRYFPVQNTAAFSFFDVLARDNGGYFEKATAWEGGSKVALTMRFPTPTNWVVRNIGDQIQTGLRILNSFDGSGALLIAPLFDVLICSNGMVRHDKEIGRLSIRHVTSAEHKIAEALKIYAKVDAYLFRSLELARELDKKIMDAEMVKRFIAETFQVNTPEARKARAAGTPESEIEVPTQTRKVRDQVFDLFFSGLGNYGRSAWDAYNAVTEYLDHYRFDNDEARAERASMIGSARTTKENAFAYLTNLKV